MIIIGLTGGIGSGKSTVAQVFNYYGVPIFTADYEGKIISDNNEKAIEEIKKLFGNDIYVDGKLNRKAVATEVFDCKEKLTKLNQIIHPLVKESFDNFCNTNSKKNFVLLESAILVDSGFYRFCDVSVLVSAPETLRISRVVNRDGISEKDVKSRINNQLREEEIEKVCRFKIINDDKNLVLPQVKNLLKNFFSNKNSL